MTVTLGEHRLYKLSRSESSASTTRTWFICLVFGNRRSALLSEEAACDEHSF